MKMLITLEEFNNLTSRGKVPLQCSVCKITFHSDKRFILEILKGYRKQSRDFCSSKCFQSTRIKQQNIKCKQCSKVCVKSNSEIQKHPNHFCSHSCTATYTNTHKTKGTVRSKLEVWLELKLRKLYPDLEILFNSKEVIGSELDIYPKLKISF